MKNLNYPVFFLVNKFVNSEKILRDVYTSLIMMLMLERFEVLDELLMDEMVKLASIDTLTCYGMESRSKILGEKSKNEFWNIEDRTELRRKKTIDNPILKKINYWK